MTKFCLHVVLAVGRSVIVARLIASDIELIKMKSERTDFNDEKQMVRHAELMPYTYYKQSSLRACLQQRLCSIGISRSEKTDSYLVLNLNVTTPLHITTATSRHTCRFQESDLFLSCMTSELVEIRSLSALRSKQNHVASLRASHQPRLLLHSVL